MSNTNSENDHEEKTAEVLTELDFIPSQEILDAEAEDVSIKINEDEDVATQETPEDRVLILETQVADLHDKYLRTVAEMENVRRRTQMEKENASKFAIANFAREMLTVSDNMNRAFTSGKEKVEGKMQSLLKFPVNLKPLLKVLK